jgi:bilin biosynthesis protein
MEPNKLAIENLKNDNDVEGLVRLLDDEDHFVREQAILALSEIGDASCALPLAQRLHDNYLDNRIAACSALIKLGNKVVEQLIEVLKDQNPLVREGAVQALEKIRDPRAIMPLIDALKDTSPKRISDALKSIGPVSFKPLIEALTNKDNRIRLGSAIALGQMKNPDAIEPLTKVTQDKDPMVRQFAESAIHRIKRDTGKESGALNSRIC